MLRLFLKSAFIIVLFLTGCSDNSTTPEEFEGKVLEEGGLKIVVLEGSYYQMGQQLGRLMRDDIYELYWNMITQKLPYWGATEGELLVTANQYWDAVIPPWFKAMCDGMALTGNLDLNQIKILQTWREIRMAQPGGSTAIIWDEYSEDGQVLIGSNIDDPESGNYAHLLCITIFRPDDAAHDLAVIGYPGVFAVQAGINDVGLCVQQNSAPMATVFTPPDYSVEWRSILSFEWLRDCGSVSDLNYKYQLADVAFGCNYQAVDPLFTVCFETAREEILQRINDNPGMLCETDHFVHNLLQNHNSAYYGGDYTGSSFVRRDNLLSKVEEMKGILNSDNLMDDILLVSESGGGVLNNTAISFTYKPFQNRLRITAPGVIDEVDINLNLYFKYGIN